MAEFKTLDEAALRKAGARGKRSATPRAVAADFDTAAHRLIVHLDNGLDLPFDPCRADGPADPSNSTFVGVTVEGTGAAVHFCQVDVDFSVA